MKSLKLKSLVMILVPVIIIFALVGSYVITVFHREQVESATTYAEAMSLVYANEAKAELERALNAARAAADLVAGLVDQGIANRAAVNASLRRMLLNNEEFLGIWVGTEPYAFDRSDYQYADTPGHDHTGRYIPYWHRDGDDITLTHLKSYDVPGDGDYYLLPLKSAEETILEPFTYEVAGQNILMITLAVPIMYSGNVIGVAGVDLAVEQLQAITDQLTIYQSGFGRLLTNKGIMVTHPTKELVGTLAPDFQGEARLKILQDLQQEIVLSEWVFSERLDTDTLKTFTPITLGKTETPWVFSVVVPKNEIFTELDKLTRQLIMVLIAGLILVALAVAGVSGTIVKPIVSLTSVIERIAGLDLTYDEQHESAKYLQSKDEVGVIARAIASMQEAITAVIISLQDIAGNVAATSEELSASAEENSASIEEVASSVGEFSQSVAGNKHSSAVMLENASSIEELATAGNDQMHMTMEAMSKIVVAAQDVKAVLEQLSGQAKNMEGILKIISDVAEQTNLLALNAAIEAARAGEHGRGFAVVAEEVRNLAEQTQNSVGDITIMITELVDNASKSARIMDEAEDQISTGNAVLSKTQAAFNEITERVTATVQGIAELTTALENMDDICNSVAAASQEQAASTAEVANTAQSLSEMGETLRGIVERFTV
ncbi:MAG: methyl-accepting chemotaxis protein [Firmicutes bacterium]|nr:methyl-accepting chemotaxis protein [Bacillota bacterium]